MAILAIIVIGTIGYLIIEHWSFIDSIYMTITTLSTVGFQEVHKLSTAGRIFTMVLILLALVQCYTPQPRWYNICSKEIWVIS